MLERNDFPISLPLKKRFLSALPDPARDLAAIVCASQPEVETEQLIAWPISVLIPNPHNTRSPAWMRFVPYRKRAKLQLSIQSLFLLTTLTAVLVYFLKWLYPTNLPWMPMLTLIPPLAGIFLLLSATRYEIWRGVLVGALLGLCLILFNRYKTVMFQHNEYASQYNPIRLTIELFQMWIFFQFTAFPLAVGCIEAIRKRYVTLGVYSLMVTFVYFFGLILTFIWIVSQDW